MAVNGKLQAWTEIQWDGNPELGQRCWRKSFGRGHVSVGAGELLLVVFSFGANSDYSFGDTRWNYDRPAVSEGEAMRALDKAWARHGYDFGDHWRSYCPSAARGFTAPEETKDQA